MSARVELAQLKRLVPLSSLNADNLQKLAANTTAITAQPGELLFKQGDIDNWAYYLLTGEVTLAGPTGTRAVKADSDVARHALAPPQPRQFNCAAKIKTQYLKLDLAFLDTLLTWDQQVAGFEVTEFEAPDAGDWMIKLLQTPAFLRLPSPNIQVLFQKLKDVPVKAGQAIVKQGEPGDYFYIIKTGRCEVTHQNAANAAPVPLAELVEGDCFGEEALLSEAPRNATVTMLIDGSLLRLAKHDFVLLMKSPLLNEINDQAGIDLVKHGAGLIDVRLESEFQHGNIRGSINVPLYVLRLKAASLDRQRKWVVYCDTGRRSAAAAYLLGQRGFDCYVLKGGLNALKKPPAAKAG